jgi:hypothetical protein
MYDINPLSMTHCYFLVVAYEGYQFPVASDTTRKQMEAESPAVRSASNTTPFSESNSGR